MNSDDNASIIIFLATYLQHQISFIYAAKMSYCRIFYAKNLQTSWDSTISQRDFYEATKSVKNQ